MIRVLLLADTHIGFDAPPARPRVRGRRRGEDFLRCQERALAIGREAAVDLIVHGGDLLDRSRTPAPLVHQALEPLLRAAKDGIPVFLVPCNHERGRIPFPLLASHPRLHVFREPRTFQIEVRGLKVAVGGFPFTRRMGDRAFRDRLAATGCLETPADLRLLLMHQAVEGATVGVHPFTFRPGPDVVSGRAMPAGVAAVLSGHIHRSQVLTEDLGFRPLEAPVLYPGSVERTSFAERGEAKSCLLLDLEAGRAGGRLRAWKRRALPARPMVVVGLDAEACAPRLLERRIHRTLATLAPDAVVRLDPRPAPSAETASVFSAASLRALAPPTMNVDVAWPRSRA